MRKMLLHVIQGVLFSIWLLPTTPPPTVAASAPTLTARATGVGLFARQDAETDRIATLEEGELLIPLAEAIGTQTWYMVRTQKGLVGWVRATDINTDHQGKDLFREKEGSSSTWSARTADGRAFNGTWNVAPNSTPKAASGGWTLSDASGATVMRGSWSADKHDTGWNGVWSATLEGGKGEYSGSWSSEFPHVRNAAFRDLFAAAVKETMRGLWTGGSASGSWSIRAAKQ